MESAALRFPNAYGGFAPDSPAFHLTDIHTPRPWANVMSNNRYGLVLSQYGGGFSWLDNCQLFRISRWDQDLTQDLHGRFVILHDLDGGPTLSTTYQPTRKRADEDLVIHDLGVTTFKRRFKDLHLEHSIWIPEGDFPGEVWTITLRNDGIKDRRFRVGTYLQWHLGGIGDWHREFHRLFMESQIVDGQTLVGWKHPGLVENQRDPLEPPTYGFVHVNGVPVERWITDQTEFIGRGGGLDDPLGLRKLPPEKARTPRWDDPIASAVFEIEVPAFDEVSFVVVIGAANTPEEAKALGAQWTLEAAHADRERTRTYWHERCAKVAVNTGDDAADFLANSWLPYQAIAGRILARCAYYQQGGAYGHRDQLQDSLMFLHSEPDQTRLQLHRHAEAMYEDGSVRHWWHPNVGPDGSGLGVDSHHSDTCLWLSYGALAYTESTGDASIWGGEHRFLKPGGGFGETGTLWEHAKRGIERALNLRSPRGLPLIQAGDWNDGLSHVGIDRKGESVWVAMFLYDILTRLAPHLPTLDASLVERYAGAAAELQHAVETHAWDGEWYIAGTRDDGRPFGSKECEEGKIFLNMQTWSVLTGIGSPERQSTAMASAKKHLVTPYGALLLQPAYSKVDNNIGYISRYAPGLRENGGVYSHASTWAILAFAQMGDLETAWSIYRGMLPHLSSAKDADLYAAEPYVMPGNVDGPDSPYQGRAGWTWYTGSAAWMVRVAKALESVR